MFRGREEKKGGEGRRGKKQKIVCPMRKVEGLDKQSMGPHETQAVAYEKGRWASRGLVVIVDQVCPRRMDWNLPAPKCLILKPEKYLGGLN